MFYRNKCDVFLRDMQPLEQPSELFTISVVASVAIEEGVETAIRRIPVPIGIMPASLAEHRGRREGDRDVSNVCCLDAGNLHAATSRQEGLFFLRMLTAYQSLFLYRRKQTAIDHECSGWIVSYRACESECNNCHRPYASCCSSIA